MKDEDEINAMLGLLYAEREDRIKASPHLDPLSMQETDVIRALEWVLGEVDDSSLI